MKTQYFIEFTGNESFSKEITFNGMLSHEKLHEFIGNCEEIMSEEGADEICLRKAYHVLIEFLQNVCKYSAFHEHEDDILVGYGEAGFGVQDDGFKIITGNKIRKKDKVRIEALINQVNSVDKAGLKEMYVKQLKKSEFNEKQGAGLGFISIRKRNKQPIDFEVIKLDNDQYYYLVKTKVLKSNM